jgi:hypothetical protein
VPGFVKHLLMPRFFIAHVSILREVGACPLRQGVA